MPAQVQDIDSAKVTEFLNFAPDRQLSILKKMPPELKEPFKTAVLQRKAILAKQAAQYPTKAEGGQSGSTFGSLAREAAIGVLEPFTAESVWGMVKQGNSVVNDLVTGQGFRGINTANEMAKGLLEAPIKPIGEMYSGVKDADYDRVAHGAGSFLSQTVPVIAGIADTAGIEAPSLADLRETAAKLNIPEKLQTRAAANRMPVPSADLPTWGKRAAVYAAGEAFGVPHVAEAAIGLDFARRWQPYRNLKAAALEKAGRALDIRKTPVGSAAAPPPVPAEAPIETVAARRSSTSADAAEEHARITSTPPLPRESLDAASPRTVYEPERLASEVPYTPNESPLDLEGKPPVTPGEPLPFEGATLESETAQPNFKEIEKALAPSGNAARKASQTMNADGSTTPFGRKLVELVPEIKKATKATAPEALMTGYQRVTQALNEVEDQVPEGTTVDTVPITGGLFELSQEYMDRGLPEVAAKIEKIREQWSGDNPAWGEFLAKKRAFFQNHNLRSAPMKRAYGILMEASSRVSPELSEANANYSTVRRALDNANVDVNTGRRISEVGKASSKASSVPMSERAAPPKSKPAVPKEVKTPAEARELLHEPQPAMLGQNAEEAMTKAAAGRRPELLKEGKEFDQTRLVESPLFQGRGGPQGFLETDARAEEPAESAKNKIGRKLSDVERKLPNPEAEASALNDMHFFAEDIRGMQGHREAAASALSSESNAAGKEIEENLRDEWAKVGKSLGVKPPPGLEGMSPGRIAKAIEKGSGKDFERVKQSFLDVAREGFSVYRQSQRENVGGLADLRRRALEAIRNRPKE